jgi:hypothetical protein
MIYVLGKYIVLSLFKEWITLDALALLDTSFCSTTSRPLFLSFMSSVSFDGFKSHNNIWPKTYLHFDGLPVLDRCTPNLLSWLKIREVSVTSIFLTDKWLTQASDCIDWSSVENLFVVIKDRDLCIVLIKILTQCVNLTSIHLECKRWGFICNDHVDILVTIIAMSCPKLVICCIYGVPITSSVVILLSQKCPNLEKVNLGRSLSDSGVDALVKNCLRVKQLSLANSRVTSLALEHLTLRRCQINAINLTDCGGHSDGPLMGLLEAHESKFESIILGYNDILNTPRLLGCIAITQRNLTSLDFSFSMETTDDDMLILCSNCKLLTTLNISSNRLLTPVSGVVIANWLTRLRCVHFRQGRSYRTKGMMFFISKRFKSFHTLEYDSVVVGIPFVGPLKLLIEHLPVDDKLSCYDDPDFLLKLQHLHTFVKLESLYGNRLNTFIQSCGNFLCVLNLSSCVKYAMDNDAVPVEGLIHQRSLLHADRGLPQATDLSDTQLSLIALHCTALESVNFSWNYHITDVGMVAVIHRNPRLTDVDCSHCGALGDLTVFALSGCIHLLNVNFHRGGHISDCSLIHLAQSCVGLESVNVVNIAVNEAVTKASLTAFVCECPDLLKFFRSADVDSWSSTEGRFKYMCSDLL